MTQDLKPSEVLAKAADLIEPEGAWTRFVAAAERPLSTIEDEKELEVGEWSSAATCWCAAGSIWRSTPRDFAEPIKVVRDRAVAYLETVIGSDIPAFNDAPERTQAEVVAALRKASALAAEAGQ